MSEEKAGSAPPPPPRENAVLVLGASGRIGARVVSRVRLSAQDLMHS
jgi:hypothetical protein